MEIGALTGSGSRRTPGDDDWFRPWMDAATEVIEVSQLMELDEAALVAFSAVVLAVGAKDRVGLSKSGSLRYRGRASYRERG